MRKLTVKIWLTIAAFFLSATVSVANCSSNANQCTPKQLCSAATSTEGGVKVWSKNSYYSKHVSKAKQVGINCGVVEIVASCDNDPELCSVDDLCKQSVQKSGGKTGWKTSSKAADHIALAKEFGLKCGVTRNSTTSTSSSASVKNASVKELCAKGTFVGNSGFVTWNTNAHANEAKKRGYTCGVGSNNSNVVSSNPRSIKKTCSADTWICNYTDRRLCVQATTSVNGNKSWDNSFQYNRHVKEAKRRGLSCGVSNDTTSASTSSTNSADVVLDALKSASVRDLCDKGTA